MIDNVSKYIRHMSRPLSLLQVELIYTSNNIVYERTDLYCDFTLTIDDLIDSTYLGHDMMDEKERLIHFNWCWDKTCTLMNTEAINFNENNHVYVYFLDLYFETFYNPSATNYKEVKLYWNHLFNYNIKKSRPDVDRFLILYKHFEKSYKNANYLI